MRVILASTVAALTLAALPAAAANAETYCVGSPAGCSGTSQPNLVAALDAADTNGPGRDEIRLGAGTFTSGPYVNEVGSPVDIVGSGPDQTTLSSTSNAASLVILDIREPTSDVENLRVHHNSAATPATGIKLAGDAEGVRVTNQNPTFFDGVQMVGQLPRLLESTVEVVYPTNLQSRAVFVPSGADGDIADSYLSAAVGVGAAVGDVTIQRTRVRGQQGVVASSGSTTVVEDSQVSTPGAQPSAFQRAALTATGNGTTTLEVDRSTVFGDGTGFGVWAQPNDGAGNNVLVDVDNTIVHNVGTAIRGVDGAASTVGLDIDYSAYDLASTSMLGNPSYSTANGFDLVPAAPGFVGENGDEPRHLRHDSPLIDRGDPGFQSFFAEDMLLRPRVLDGDGTGSPARRVDIGALEYRYTKPDAVATATPTSATPGQPVTFDGSGSSDRDVGDALTFTWAFDDGGSATGPTASHAFATPGSHTATLTVTDPTGQTGTATATVAVLSPADPGPGGGNPGGDPQPPQDPPAAALELGALKLAPARFRTKRPRGSKKGKLGTTIAYRLSDAASVTITVERSTPGRRSGTKCAKPSRRNRKGRKCTRWVKVGTLSHAGAAGDNSLPWTGKLSRRALTPGRYRAAAQARRATGTATPTRRASFTVLR